MTTAVTTMAVLALLGGCAAAQLGDGAAIARTTAGGLGCRLEQGAGHYRAVVVAGDPVAGDWRLRLSGDGLDVAQSGDFALGAGERRVLSEAALGRQVPEAALTLQVGGRTVDCPLAQ